MAAKYAKIDRVGSLEADFKEVLRIQTLLTPSPQSHRCGLNLTWVMSESQVLLMDGQVVFPRVLWFSPTFDERSVRYK